MMANVLKKMMLRVSEYLEIVLAVYLVIVLILVIGRTLVVETPLIFTEGASIHHFLEGSLTLAIAIEFLKLLCMHTPGTLIEVLLFAIARHMIVEHLTPLQNLLIVISIAVLFLIRKYSLTTHDQKGMNEHANSTNGIIQDLLDLRREKSAISKYMEGSREIKKLERAESELRRQDEAKAKEKEKSEGLVIEKQNKKPE